MFSPRFPPKRLLGVPVRRRLPQPVLRGGRPLCPRHAEAAAGRPRRRRRHRPHRLRGVRRRDHGRRRRRRLRQAGQAEAERGHDNVRLSQRFTSQSGTGWLHEF